MPRQTHLLNRKGTYYFRLSLPPALKVLLGQSELHYSLRTKSYPEARIRCMAMSNAAYDAFHMVKYITLTQDQARQLVKKFFDAALQRLENQVSTAESVFADHLNQTTIIHSWLMPDRKASQLDFLIDAKHSKPYDGELPKPAGGFELVSQRYTNATMFTNGQPKPDIENITSAFFAQEGIYPASNISMAHFDTALKQAITRLLEIQKARLGDESIDQITDDWLPLTPNSASPNLIPPSLPLVSSVVAAYRMENDGLKDRTKHSQQDAHSLLIDYFGDVPIGDITKDGVRNFKTVLRKKPLNSQKLHPGKSLNELAGLNLPPESCISTKTVNKHLANLSAVWSWANRTGMYEAKNPFEGQRIQKNDQGSNERNPFAAEVLELLFSSTIYRGCKSTKRRYESGPLIIQDALYWIPLIGLFTGARLGEICQLSPADIKTVDGILVFDLHDENIGSSLKNKSSRRQIPIHNQLLELGLVNHVQSKSVAESSLLFPEVFNLQHPSYLFSKKFSHLIKALGLKSGKQKNTFHSFRHSMEDALREAGVEDRLTDVIMGHKTQHISAIYGKGYSLVSKQEAINKVQFPINWSKLKAF